MEKYIEQFNKRITPLLVCFHPDIRNKILITNPKDKQYFTEEQSKLVSGYPNKEGDQDTYEALMTPEKKEIEYWLRLMKFHHSLRNVVSIGMLLLKITRKRRKKRITLCSKRRIKKYLDILDEITNKEVEEFETDGVIPQALNSIVTLNATDMRFYFKKIPDRTPSTGGFVFDDIQYNYAETVDALADF